MQRARPFGWICCRCSKASTFTTRSQRAPFSSNTPRTRSRLGVRRVVVFAAAGGIGAGALAFTDDIKHGYAAVERSGRVVSTLFICINEYDRASKNLSPSADVLSVIV